MAIGDRELITNDPPGSICREQIDGTSVIRKVVATAPVTVSNDGVGDSIISLDDHTKRKFLIVNSGQYCAAGWEIVDVTGGSVTWTSSVAEDLLIGIQSNWNRGTAGPSDCAFLKLKLDATDDVQVLRFSLAADDWPCRATTFFYENVSAGDHTLKLRFGGTSTQVQIMLQSMWMLRLRRV